MERTIISETHEQLGDMVAAVYKKVDWKKQTSLKRSALDIFTDRIRVASHEPDILTAFDKLCSSLHIPTARTDKPNIYLSDLLEWLSNSEDSMEIMRNHTGYIASLGQKKAKEAKNEN